MTRDWGLLVGFVVDRLLGDPQRFHPVAGFGTLATRLEARTYADARGHGVLHVAVLVGGAAWLGRRLPCGVVSTSLVTWSVLGGTTLDREAQAVGLALEQGDLSLARTRVARLVGRGTETLDETGVARAVIESVAENTSDAVVAPLLWGAVAGVPGLLIYRAANTLDAMIGHRSPRYERFGWAAARLDDALNLPAARLTALLTVALGGDPPAGIRAWHRDAAGHPSPNAGPIEAAFAGSLGLRLGGTNTYGGRTENRALLGDGATPTAHDVARARKLAGRVQVVAIIVLAPIAARHRRRPRS